MEGKEWLNKIHQGNVLEVLRQMPDEFVDCIVTSPPYWGLRDYGEETYTIWGGDPNCEHQWEVQVAKHDNLRPSKVSEKAIVGSNKELRFRTGEKVKNAFCVKCGAWYGQLGLEPTLDLYMEHLLMITSELKRVLKKTGILFWNHGDSYGGSGAGTWKNPPEKNNAKEVYRLPYESNPRRKTTKSFPPPKCMALQNYRLIFRMIDEQGWILRNVIIWHKVNHMPCSAKDRFTNAYEPVFMLVKNKKYWFDLEAVKIPLKCPNAKSKNATNKHKGYGNPIYSGFEWDATQYSGKNPGDVWTIPTQPFPEAHFAVFPEKLITPMIKAGCPPAGIVLDPFMGSGTTAVVAQGLGRNWIGIELNPEYIEMAYRRLKNEFGLFMEEGGREND